MEAWHQTQVNALNKAREIIKDKRTVGSTSQESSSAIDTERLAADINAFKEELRDIREGRVAVPTIPHGVVDEDMRVDEARPVDATKISSLEAEVDALKEEVRKNEDIRVDEPRPIDVQKISDLERERAALTKALEEERRTKEALLRERDIGEGVKTGRDAMVTENVKLKAQLDQQKEAIAEAKKEKESLKKFYEDWVDKFVKTQSGGDDKVSERLQRELTAIRTQMEQERWKQQLEQERAREKEQERQRVESARTRFGGGGPNLADLIRVAKNKKQDEGAGGDKKKKKHATDDDKEKFMKDFFSDDFVKAVKKKREQKKKKAGTKKKKPVTKKGH
jgi:chromosome segregation ATPase